MFTIQIEYRDGSDETARYADAFNARQAFDLMTAERTVQSATLKQHQRVLRSFNAQAELFAAE